MPDVTDSVLGELATALNDLYRLSGSARFHEQTVAATGVAVSRTGLHFLSLVADTGPVSATRLATGLDLSQPTASRVLQSLETEGLVTRQADDKDGRVSHYAVTPKGRRALDKVHSYHVQILTTALADVEPRRREAVAAAVTELVQRLHPDRQADDRSSRRTA
jgi:DNA-binding MarR family transcriptional regulator